MKNERPIIMSSESIIAILAGRKTQTRRVVKPLAESLPNDTNVLRLIRKRCPYGHPGDNLWVRETWRVADGYEYTLTAAEWEGGQNPAHIEYKANDPHPENVKWRSPLYMPKWAARLWLEISNIRVERLQEITSVGIESEGINPRVRGQGGCREDFKSKWNKLNAKRGYGYAWEANPAVWVIEFTDLLY